MSQWHPVCDIRQILPGSGVCSLIKGQQIAIFRPCDDEQLYALSTIDPFFEASVLSRGLIVEHQKTLWVASPLKKQRFRLSDGLCMEDESRSVASFPLRVSEGQAEVYL